MIATVCLAALLASSLLAITASPSSHTELSNRCTGTISSLADVANAIKCTTVNINAFTVPAGSQLNLNLLDGTHVNLNGDVQFGNLSWAGPLFQISGNNVKFNGNGHRFDGGGPFYWDGQGSNGGVGKPRPMMSIRMSGTFSNTRVINSPAHTFGVTNTGPLVIQDVIIDNSQGNQPNARSYGKPAAANTDGFDCSTTDLIIERCSVINQDDCLAINRGSNIVFSENTCRGGHGISIGSVSSDVSISDIVISNNTIINNVQALRIKTDADASYSTVTNITYSGNTGLGLRRFGFLIDQSYPATLKTPGTGVVINDINFVGATNTLTVDSSATAVAINCGVGSCTGTWDWSCLKTSEGPAFVTNPPQISGYYI